MGALDRAAQAIHETERRLGDVRAAQSVAEHLLSLRPVYGADPRLRRRIASALAAASAASAQAEQARQRAIAALAAHTAGDGT